MLCSVLIVEDDLEMGVSLSESLRAQSLLPVLARSGEEAITIAKEQAPDCILLDLGLPDIDGLEVLQRLRRFCSSPLIVISARGSEVQKVTALDLGADDYLVKPIGPCELFARIRALQRRLQQPDTTSNEVRIGDVVIDLALRKLRRGDRDFHLTPTEFSLLAQLVAAKGRLVTHRKLLTAVWGADAVEQTHYLRIYMARLRQKLERVPAEPEVLLTEPGVGYRLADFTSKA